MLLTLRREALSGVLRGLLLGLGSAVLVLLIEGDRCDIPLAAALLSWLATLVAAQVGIVLAEAWARRRQRRLPALAAIGGLGGLTPLLGTVAVSYAYAAGGVSSTEGLAAAGAIVRDLAGFPLALLLAGMALAGGVAALVSYPRLSGESSPTLRVLILALAWGVPMIFEPCLYASWVASLVALSVIYSFSDRIATGLHPKRLPSELARRCARGELTVGEVRLAALLGDEEAQAYLDDRSQAPTSRDLIRGLGAHGAEALARACLALAELLSPEHPEPARARQELELVRALLHQPQAQLPDHLSAPAGSDSAAEVALRAAAEAVAALSGGASLAICGGAARRALAAAAGARPERALLLHLQGALLPWALHQDRRPTEAPQAGPAEAQAPSVEGLGPEGGAD